MKRGMIIFLLILTGIGWGIARDEPNLTELIEDEFFSTRYFHAGVGLMSWGYIGWELGVGFRNNLYLGLKVQRQGNFDLKGPGYTDAFDDTSYEWKHLTNNFSLGGTIGYDIVKKVAPQYTKKMKFIGVMGFVLRAQLSYLSDVNKTSYEPRHNTDEYSVITALNNRLNVSMRAEMYLDLVYFGFGLGVEYHLTGISADAGKPFYVGTDFVMGFCI